MEDNSSHCCKYLNVIKKTACFNHLLIVWHNQLISGMYLGDLITCFIDLWGTDTDDVGQIALSSLPLLVCSSAVICSFVVLCRSLSPSAETRRVGGCQGCRIPVYFRRNITNVLPEVAWKSATCAQTSHCCSARYTICSSELN